MSQGSFRFKDWTLTVDRTETSEAYKKADHGSAEACGCDYCLNFSAQRTKVYPDQIKQLFANLGIDFRKEAEITHYGKVENEKHLYGGWFHFQGGFEGMDCEVPLPAGGFQFDLITVENDFEIGFRNAKDLTIFEETDELVQIEFQCRLPWILKEKLEPE